MPQAWSGRGCSPSEASSTISMTNDQWFQGSMVNDADDGLVNDQLLGRQSHSSPPLARVWNHFFGFQLRARNLTPFRTLKIHQIKPKMPQKPSPRPSQNASKTASHLTMPEILKKCNPSIRKPHFWRFQTLENRPKIDAKTPWKSALSWIPSWNPKKYDFWC